ncbi:MAG: PilZ domain-containing protein [Desulfosarcinaceae bacterium]
MSSVIPITDDQKIRAHFEALYKVQHEKGVSLEAGGRLTVHRLIYDVSRPGELLLKVEGTACTSLSSIDVHYSLGGKPHRFRTEVISCRCMGTAGAILKLRLPDRIGVLNRREHLRLRPPASMPVTLTLTSPEGSLPSSQVRDISSGGLGFAVPVGSLSLARGAKIPVRIDLAGGIIVPATVIIRHLIPEEGMVRVGAEFVALSAEGRQKICDYVILATLGPDRLGLASQGQSPLVCVIGEGVEEEDLSQLERPYRGTHRTDHRRTESR